MKKQIRFFALCALLAGTCLCLTGCGNYVGKEKTHPLFVKAGSCKLGGDYKEAARYFEEFLCVCPKSPLAHYEAAVLYADHLEDPVAASWHFRKYLELSPAGSEDAADVKKMLESSDRKQFALLSKKYESQETTKAYAELEKTRSMLEKYKKYSDDLRNLCEVLRRQNSEMRKIISSGSFHRKKSSVPQTGATAASSAESTPAAATAQAEQPASAPAGKTEQPVRYTVKPGDTLYGISRQIYGSTRYYERIRQANPDQLGPGKALRAGQTLVIPPLSEKK